MPVVFGPNEAGAVGYGASGIAESMRASSEAMARGEQMRMARDRMNMEDLHHQESMQQQAAMFNAGRRPSERDRWEADSRVQSALAINQGQLSQAENMRLQRLASSKSSIDEALARGDIEPGHARELHAQVEGQMSPLQYRQAQGQVAMQQQQIQHATQANRLKEGMRLQNEGVANGSVQPVARYNPHTLGQMESRFRASGYSPEQSRQMAQAELGRTGDGVEYGNMMLQPNGSREWVPAFTGGGTGRASSGGAGGAGSANAPGGARSPETIHQIHQEFNTRWDAEIQPTIQGWAGMNPQQRLDAREAAMRSFTTRRLTDLQAHSQGSNPTALNPEELTEAHGMFNNFEQTLHLRGLPEGMGTASAPGQQYYRQAIGRARQLLSAWRSPSLMPGNIRLDFNEIMHRLRTAPAAQTNHPGQGQGAGGGSATPPTVSTNPILNPWSGGFAPLNPRFQSGVGEMQAWAGRQTQDQPGTLGGLAGGARRAWGHVVSADRAMGDLIRGWFGD